MATKAKKVEPKFKPNQEVTLKNAWAKKVNPEGLPATIKEVRSTKDGTPVYLVEAVRPPVPLSALEDDLLEIT